MLLVGVTSHTVFQLVKTEISAVIDHWSVVISSAAVGPKMGIFTPTCAQKPFKPSWRIFGILEFYMMIGYKS